MGYNHPEKIGNQGDLFKHSILAAVVQKKLSEVSENTLFNYVESHAAYAEYTLPDHKPDAKKHWPAGIGCFARRCGLDWSDLLLPYQKSAFRSALDEIQREERNVDSFVCGFDRYPGSSTIVYRLIRRHRFQFTLYDVDTEACSSLAEYFPMWDSVRIRREDGYKGVQSLEKGVQSLESVTLVHVDPPDMNRLKLLDLAKHLHDCEIPFMMWTPRIGNSQNPTTEGEQYIQFRDEMQSELSLPPILARWHENWRSETCGCCVHVFPKSLHEQAVKVGQTIRKIMKWKDV